VTLVSRLGAENKTVVEVEEVGDVLLPWEGKADKSVYDEV
jgi:hypothetical protein